MEKHLFLIGFMGAGKSYLGQRLAQKHGLLFYDLDLIIETQKNKSITQLFEQLGPDIFRQIEAETLRSLEQLPPGIVAVGGGTPCFLDNIYWMNTHGNTVYLKMSVDALLPRLISDNKRPLLAGKKDIELELFVRQLLKERSVYYEQSALIVEQDAIPDLSDKLESFFGRF